MRPVARIAAWAFAAVVAAAPCLTLAAQDCSPCCCPPTQCHTTVPECGTLLAPTSCSVPAPLALSAVAKRQLEAPSFQPAPPAHVTRADAAPRARPPARGGDLAILISPLRLSVVLLV